MVLSFAEGEVQRFRPPIGQRIIEGSAVTVEEEIPTPDTEKDNPPIFADWFNEVGIDGDSLLLTSRHAISALGL